MLLEGKVWRDEADAAEEGPKPHDGGLNETLGKPLAKRLGYGAGAEQGRTEQAHHRLSGRGLSERTDGVVEEVDQNRVPEEDNVECLTWRHSRGVGRKWWERLERWRHHGTEVRPAFSQCIHKSLDFTTTGIPSFVERTLLGSQVS
jgi:hypothetical protein